MSAKARLFILIILSFVVHFAFFGHPAETVFDEVHFGKFASAYYTHQYYFDIHPPLGKLMLAGMGKLSGFRPEYSFAEIGQPFPDWQYMVLRFLPSLAGAFLPIVIYFLALELGLSGLSAFGAGMLVALDNALLTQSRYILLDPFLLLFGFSGLLFYFKSRSIEAKPLYRGLASILFALAASIKWTGLTFLALASIIELFDLSRIRLIGTFVRRAGKIILFFALIPLVVYFSVFTVHLKLLPRPGPGDAYMTPEFRQKNLIGKFIELNQEMYRANATLTATHPYSSKWYTWPLMSRPIYYWFYASDTTPTQEKIYLIGNPFVWWASTVAIAYLLMQSMHHVACSIRNKKWLGLHGPCYILLGAWFINLLPFIGISRVMFLYHYLTALIFAILALAWLIDNSKHPPRNWKLIIFLAALLFIYFVPLSYGLPLEAARFKNHIWLPTWQ